jgi:hypothetical protein
LESVAVPGYALSDEHAAISYIILILIFILIVILALFDQDYDMESGLTPLAFRFALQKIPLTCRHVQSSRLV